MKTIEKNIKSKKIKYRVNNTNILITCLQVVIRFFILFIDIIQILHFYISIFIKSSVK